MKQAFRTRENWSDQKNLSNVIQLPKDPFRPKMLNLSTHPIYQYKQSSKANELKKVVMNTQADRSFLLLFSQRRVIEVVHQGVSVYRTEPSPESSTTYSENFLDAVYLPGIKAFILITESEVYRKDISNKAPYLIMKLVWKLNYFGYFNQGRTLTFKYLLRVPTSPDQVIIRYTSVKVCLIFNAKTRKIELPGIDKRRSYHLNYSPFFDNFSAIFGFLKSISQFNLFEIKKRDLVIKSQEIFNPNIYQSKAFSV